MTKFRITMQTRHGEARFEFATWRQARSWLNDPETTRDINAKATILIEPIL